MPRLTSIAVACTALALALGACGKDDESDVGRNAGGSGATVTSSPTPEPGTSTQSDAEQANDSVSIGIKDIKFVPDSITAKVGQKIVWTNNESIPHDVTATGGADFASKTMRKDDTYEFTPTKAGTITYVCTIHSGQNGEIDVTG